MCPLLPQTDADGQYRVLVVDHVGDTRGSEFYSRVTCVGIDAPVPMGLIARGSAS